MRRAIVMGCLLAGMGCGGATTPAAETVQPAPLPPIEVTQKRMYVGEDGLKVAVVDLAGDEAFIQVTGADSPIAGLVLSYKKIESGRDLRYQTQWHGRTWNVVVRNEFRGQHSWKAYLPDSGKRDGHALAYSEEQSPTINVEAIQRAHVTQQGNGTLDAVQRFDREAEEASQVEAMVKDAERTSEACATPITFTAAWDTVTDEQILEKSISGYCGSAMSALRNVCRYEAGKAWVAEHAKWVTCRLDGQGVMTPAQGGITWAINFELYNLDDKARDAVQAMEASNARSLLSAIQDEKTAVCADEGKSHYVVVGPEDAAHGGLAYGDGTTFHKVNTPRMLGSGWFFEPRHRNEQNNANFRGYDLRVYSHVDVDPKKPEGGCSVTCGSRKVPLVLLAGEDKTRVLSGAKYLPSPMDREPYALARDRRGVYYLVDRGTTEETEKDFRLYRGMRGRLKPLSMKDVVSDSEGEIFASSGGKLRLLVGKEDAQWVSSGKTKTLKRLPIQENYGLIYNELGIYLTQELGNPCDDL